MTFGKLIYSLMILSRSFEMIKKSKETLSTTLLIENLEGIDGLLELLKNSFDNYVDNLTENAIEKLEDEIECFEVEFRNFKKSI